MDPKFTHLFVFSALLLVYQVDGRISSDKYLKDSMLHLKMPARNPGTASVLREQGEKDGVRVRRAAGSSPSAEPLDKLKVHTTILPDQSHNEAIVHWTGKNSSVMFILSRQHSSNGSVPSSTLWRSENYGSSFSEVSMPGKPVIAYYLAAPRDKRKLLFVDANKNKIYRTTDEGKHYNAVIGCPTSTDKLVFHPTNESTILCYSERDHTLYVSVDFCTSWDLVHHNVNPRFFWGIPGQDQDMFIIHMEVLDPVSGHYQYKAVTRPYPTEVVENRLDSIEVDSLLVINEYIFAQKSSRYATWLYVSWKRQPFKMAYFPNNKHPEDLNIIDADESEVFIAGSQPSTGLFYSLAELFLSDTTGQIYISTLGSVTSVGLKEIHGLRGVYIANPKSGVGTSASLQTKITFDQGGQWSNIQAPVNDVQGNPTNCHLADGCSLHLTHVVSEDTAPGIILGSGNYGKGLTGFDNVTLFLSTDGGLTWNCTLAKPDYYEANILDQGGAVVAVPQSLNDKKNIIHYSHDEGMTWHNYIYLNDSMRVDAVLNDPGATTRTVVIFGHDETKQGWVIVMVDFSSILERQCGADDYQDWIPTDQNKTRQCLLGQEMKYKRRKPKSDCFNGKDYTQAVSTKPCPCVLEDYECDFGYKKSEKGTTCVPEKWFDSSKPVGDCPENGFYNKSKGYRKVASDKCMTDIDKLKPVKTPCPKMKAEGLHIVLVSQHVVPINKPVQFSLVQERGSKKSTKYSWNYGDDAKSKTYEYTGFELAKSQNHTYQKRGLFTVKVTATNPDGTTTASLNVLVEDKIDGLYVEIPHGAQINQPVLFEVSLSPDMDMFFGSKPGVHFMWKFGEETSEKELTLTWETSVVHTYKAPGNYNVFVEAMNGGDSTIFQIFQLPVYGTLTTVQMTFDKVVDQLNDGSLIWNALFAKALKEALFKSMYVDYSRMEVVVLKDTTQTVADVSVLPIQMTSTSDSTIDSIVKRLLKLPSANFTIHLTKDEFKVDYKARVATANVYSAGASSDAKNYIAVYVCVPILVAAIFVSMLVVLYYKKTFSSAQRRYRLLRSQEGGPEPDSLLDDTDDDDPLLDPNVDESNQRLALSDDEATPPGVDPLGLLSADRRNPDV